MFHHRKHSLWQRAVMFIRDVRSMATCHLSCPGCGGSNVTGDDSSWICHDCGAQGQS